MPNTYVALKTETVAVATPSVTFSLSGISGYTDLVIVSNVAVASAGTSLNLRFNSDTGSNYSYTNLYGDGSAASSVRGTNATKGYASWYVGLNTSIENANITHIMNYSHSTTYKTAISRSNRASASNSPGTEAVVSLWRNTNAITSITLAADSGNISVGSTFSLYGIANADQGSAKATGGIITEDSQYWYHTFGASGAFIPKQSLTCDVLVVAGGGGGGGVATSTSNYGGSGAAGGVSYLAGTSLTSTSYSITVGGGGTGGSGNAVGSTGTASNFNSSIISNGGAGGASSSASSGAGISGGSGSGGAGSATVGSATQGSTGGATGYGNAGGAGSSGAGQNSIGGSGGAGAAGGAGVQNVSGGNGGSGLNTWSSWMTTTGIGVSGYIAGGGAGFLQNGTAIGTSNAGAGVPAAGGGSAATVNTGSGGGGSIYLSGSSTGGAGGSGVVIVRYAK
jgi:hypothetical protein